MEVSVAILAQASSVIRRIEAAPYGQHQIGSAMSVVSLRPWSGCTFCQLKDFIEHNLLEGSECGKWTWTEEMGMNERLCRLTKGPDLRYKLVMSVDGAMKVHGKLTLGETFLTNPQSKVLSAYLSPDGTLDLAPRGSSATAGADLAAFPSDGLQVTYVCAGDGWRWFADVQILQRDMPKKKVVTKAFFSNDGKETMLVSHHDGLAIWTGLGAELDWSKTSGMHVLSSMCVDLVKGFLYFINQ